LYKVTEVSGAHVYGYDPTDRLISATHPNLPQESYAYDGVGNRTASQQSSAYTYQPFNKLASTATATYSYDNNGNLTSKTDTSGRWAYTWDYENRLTQVTRPDGVSVTYKYDALGRRIQRSKNGTSTNYIYDGQDVVKDINSDGSTVEYLNGLGVDNKLRQTSSAGTFYFMQDQLGSTHALTDSSGNVVEQEQYDSFGDGAGSSLTRYGYTGRERDADTGLYYYRARWYDPQAGRFISEDPIGFEGGINPYAYVENNPLNNSDPEGLAPKDRWYGHNNRDFHNWFHRCWKEAGDPDANKEEVARAYQEWISRGSPKGGRCWGGGSPTSCPERQTQRSQKRWPGPTMEELRLNEESNRQMERFWGKVLGGSIIGGAAVIGGPAVAAPVIRWFGGLLAGGGAAVAAH